MMGSIRRRCVCVCAWAIVVTMTTTAEEYSLRGTPSSPWRRNSRRRMGGGLFLDQEEDLDDDGTMRVVGMCPTSSFRTQLECVADLRLVSNRWRRDGADGMRVMRNFLHERKVWLRIRGSWQVEELKRLGYQIEMDPVRRVLGLLDRRIAEKEEEEEVPYGVQMVSAPTVWKSYGAKGRGVTVCVVDSGLTASHSDFQGKEISGTDFESLEWKNGSNEALPWNEDGTGHGTHVAGTVGASDNGDGVVGVAPEASIHVVRVFGMNGKFRASDLEVALQECEMHGAKIVNLSLGGGSSSADEEAMLDRLRARGLIVVAAAGNTGNNAQVFPAAYDNVLSVAAVDAFKRVARFSTRNGHVDVAAPGVSVKSTWKDGMYAVSSGTSTAAPHVAGVLALLWSHRLDATRDQILGALLASTEDLGIAGWDDETGYGLINARRGILKLDEIMADDRSNPSPPPAPEATPEPTSAWTPMPTLPPTPSPTPPPTSEPTLEPTLLPTLPPTPELTLPPTSEPTPELTPPPTPEPTPKLTPPPTPEPTPASTVQPTPTTKFEVTTAPTQAPTLEPTPAFQFDVTASPTSSPVRTTVGDDSCTPVSFDMRADSEVDPSTGKSQTSFAMRDEATRSVLWKRAALEPGFEYQRRDCLDLTRCYHLILFDTGRDGGTRARLFVDGRLDMRRNRWDGLRYVHHFGDGCGQ